MPIDKRYGSAEYTPTPDQQLPAFRGGVPRGYVCPKCGHMELEVDDIFGLTCKKCFSQWLLDHDFQQLTSIKDMVEQDKERQFALEPTQKHEIVTKEFKEATTKIIKKQTKIKKNGIINNIIHYIGGLL